MADKDVAMLVAGAGPTGLALAIEMARAGLPVRIIDKNSGPARWSQALVVQARTLEQFERYGIAEKAVAEGHPVSHAALYDGSHRFLEIDLSRVQGRYPYALFLPQSKTEALLLAHLGSLGIEVERETELLDFEDGALGGTASLRRNGSAPETVAFRWLAGCDGAHSKVRHQLNIPFEGSSVGLRFFLGDLKLEGADVPGDELVVHTQRGNVLFLARLDDEITRVIVIERGEQNEAANRTPEVAEFQRWIDAFHLRIRVNDAVWRAPFHINERRADRYRMGNVFIAGDASHIHSPVAGQGMNTGIQDAANLAWKLAAVSSGAPESLLDSYEEERGAVGKALLKRTSAGLAAATTSNPVAELLRDAVGMAVSHLPAIQEKVAAFISETSIQYRDSSAVNDDGGSGSLRAGDRVPNPDVALADGTTGRLLAPLAEPKHLLITQGLSDVTALRGVTRIALAGEQQQQVREQLGAATGLWLVRPDGYLGFRSASLDSPALADYARTVGIAAV